MPLFWKNRESPQSLLQYWFSWGTWRAFFETSLWQHTPVLRSASQRLMRYGNLSCSKFGKYGELSYIVFIGLSNPSTSGAPRPKSWFFCAQSLWSGEPGEYKTGNRNTLGCLVAVTNSPDHLSLDGGVIHEKDKTTCRSRAAIWAAIL